MRGLLAALFTCGAWAQCDPSDPFCRDQSQAADAKRNSWKTQKVVYCDSTIEPMQRCKDLTPCSPKYLDCTKGPNRCICEIINPVGGGTSVDLKSMVERISTIPSLSTLGFLIKDPHFSDFVSLLNKPGPMTLFVPTNDAFQNAGVDTSNYQQMKEILKYHLVPNDALLTSNLFPFQVVTNSQGNSIKVSKDQNAWVVDGAKVVLPDLRVSNGVIWLIDRVLTPQNTQGLQPQGFLGFVGQDQAPVSNFNQGNFQKDNQGFQGQSQSQWVPQGQSFQQILSQRQQGQGIGLQPQPNQVQGNVLQQGSFLPQQAQGLFPQQGSLLQQGQGQGNFIPQGQGQGNLGQGNFIPQAQGQQLTVQGIQQRSFLVDPSNSNGQGQVKSIAERVMSNPQLTTFAFLLNDPRYSDIVQLLSGPGPVTVFIPTNEAFSKSGIDTTNVEMVRELLKHHIVTNMAVSSADFAPFQKLFTAEGDKLKITAGNSCWMVDDAKILVPDVQAKNGVIFLIDRVLGIHKPQLQGGANRGAQGSQVHTPVSGSQGQWHGAGLYCAAQTELYYCNEKTECVLQESCKNGCVHADPGFPDYCFVSDLKTNSRGGGIQLPNFQLPNVNQAPFQQGRVGQ